MKKAKVKTWSKMTVVEKRKAIAADVIANIKNQILVITKADYCTLNISANSRKEFQQQLKTKRSCKVCAMGALMASDIINRNNALFLAGWDGDDVVSRLKNIFSEHQLRLIETAFEKSVIESLSTLYDDETDDITDLARNAIKFGSKYTDNKNRLVAIMNNIIADPKGLFNPYNK